MQQQEEALLAKSFICSDIEPETSIRQNITARAEGFGDLREPAIAQIHRIDPRHPGQPAQTLLPTLAAQASGNRSSDIAIGFL